MKRLSIKTKLILVMIVTLMAPLTVVTLTSLGINLRRSEKALLHSNDAALDNAFNQLIDYERRAENIGALLAGFWQGGEPLQVRTVGRILEAGRNCWFEAIVEVFDVDRHLVARASSRRAGIDNYYTKVNDPALLAALDLNIRTDLFRRDDALCVKAFVPIVDYQNLSVRGVVVVSFPVTEVLLQSIKQYLDCEVSLLFPKTGKAVSTLVDEGGSAYTRIWDSGIADIALKGPRQSRFETIGGQRYAVSYRPVTDSRGDSVGVLATATHYSAVTRQVESAIDMLAATSAIAFGAALLMGTLFALTCTRPIYRLFDAMMRVAGGNLKVRVEEEDKGEFGKLARAFNEMASRLEENQEALQRAARVRERYAKELEVKVAERTLELSRRNEELREEIEQRKQMAQKLQDSERKYRDLIESANDGIAILQDSAFRYVNPRLVEMSGYRAEELIGRPFDSLVCVTRPVLVGKEGAREDGSGNPVRYEANLWHRRGWMVEVEISESGPEEPGERLRLVLVRDLTEQKELEKERFRARNLESVRVLAGGIAHDFNNLLTAVLGNISLAKLRLDDPGQAGERLSRSEEAIFKAQDLTRQLLEFASEAAPPVELVDLAEIARRLLAGRKDHGRIPIHWKVDENLWPVRGDALQLEDVLRRVLTNAEEAIDDRGEVCLEAVNYELNGTSGVSLPAGPYLRISVSDSGRGIDENQREKIFDPYYSTKQRCSNKGMGLGLAIVHSIIKQHHGAIELNADRPRGTEVVIYLPAVPVNGCQEVDQGPA